MKRTIFLFFLIFLCRGQPIFANEFFVYPPTFFSSGWNIIDVKNLDILVIPEYNLPNFGTCLQSQESLNDEINLQNWIYSLKEKYSKYLSWITWDDYNGPRTRCKEDSDAMVPTKRYPMSLLIRYWISHVEKNLIDTRWILPLGITNSSEILTYPSSFFLTRESSSPSDIVWYSNGNVWQYGTYSDSLIASFVPVSQGGLFSLTGIVQWTGLTTSIRKDWYGGVRINTHSWLTNTETIHFMLWGIWKIMWTFQVFMYPDGKNINVDLYKNWLRVRKMKRNIDYWIRPSRIESGRYIIFRPEKLQLFGDEVKISFSPIGY